MVRHVLKRMGVIACMLAVSLLDVNAQMSGSSPVRREFRTAFNITLGVSIPLERDGLREFWVNGPGGAVEFLVNVSPSFSLGIGADMCLLYFDEAAFASRWPGVVLKEKKDLFLGNVYLNGIMMLLPDRQTSPFISAQVGAEFISEAVFREVIGGVRYTYYNVGGKPRVSLGAATGALVSVSSGLGVLLELKATFVHNDPNVKLLLHGRAGVQYKL